jgi:hypothetical protein
MAGIPDDKIERLKEEIPPERLVTSFGVELKWMGTNPVGLCPCREDRALWPIVAP